MNVRGKRIAIIHGQGTRWDFGIPLDQYVWESVEYSEHDCALPEGGMIVAARGKKPDGSVWHYVGTARESAPYVRLKDAAAIALLDKGLDGFCVSTR